MIVFVSEIYFEPCFKAVADCIKEKSVEMDTINILVLINSLIINITLKSAF